MYFGIMIYNKGVFKSSKIYKKCYTNMGTNKILGIQWFVEVTISNL